MNNTKQSLFKKFKTSVRVNLQNIGLIPVRADFLEVLPKHGEGIELGVFQGEFSKVLIERTKPKKLHLVDPWWKTGDEYYGEWSRFHNGGALLSTKKAHQQTKDIVAEVDTQNVAQIYVEDDILILKKIKDKSLDWAYVDSTHLYEHTVLELIELERTIKKDGIIAGHDWHPDPNHRHHGVYLAVKEFCEKYNWKVLKIDQRYTQWAIVRK